MKSLFSAVGLAIILATPIASYAQSNAPLTRAEVRAQLVAVESAGYRAAAGRDPYYPEDAQKAVAGVAAERVADQGDISAGSYGSSTNGSIQSGSSTPAKSPSQSVFFTGR